MSSRLTRPRRTAYVCNYISERNKSAWRECRFVIDYCFLTACEFSAEEARTLSFASRSLKNTQTLGSCQGAAFTYQTGFNRIGRRFLFFYMIACRLLSRFTTHDARRTTHKKSERIGSHKEMKICDRSVSCCLLHARESLATKSRIHVSTTVPRIA